VEKKWTAVEGNRVLGKSCTRFFIWMTNRRMAVLRMVLITPPLVILKECND
jgi:hypothetical protein